MRKEWKIYRHFSQLSPVECLHKALPDFEFVCIPTGYIWCLTAQVLLYYLKPFVYLEKLLKMNKTVKFYWISVLLIFQTIESILRFINECIT